MITPFYRRPAEILLVEDDDGDALLTEKALESGPINVKIRRVDTGEKAISYLSNTDGYADASRPDLILLDLNLPGTHGSEVLRFVKQDRDLRRIPVVVLTSSKAESDILRSLNDYTNAYMVKPGTAEVFAEIARTLEEFWFENSVLLDR
jgi:CheY-like chemotaxis protein